MKSARCTMGMIAALMLLFMCRYLSAMAPSILLIQAGVQACSEVVPESPHEQRMLGTLGPMLRALQVQLTLPPSSAAELAQRVQAMKQARAAGVLVTQFAGHVCQSVSTRVASAG
jgi:hypothetical protein